MRLKTGYSPVLWGLLAVLVAAVPARAQSTATLRGTVTDTQGAALPGANITVRNQATGEERTAVSDRDGIYRFPSLAPGLYRLEVKLDKFQSQVMKDIRLEVAQIVRAEREAGDWEASPRS